MHLYFMGPLPSFPSHPYAAFCRWRSSSSLLMEHCEVFFFVGGVLFWQMSCESGATLGFILESKMLKTKQRTFSQKGRIINFDTSWCMNQSFLPLSCGPSSIPTVHILPSSIDLSPINGRKLLIKNVTPHIMGGRHRR